ncbi:hypothetical protein ACF0H5_002105 [Mactra antiquata]
MECRKCSVVKLPNEFAPENITEECEHPALLCLRCVVNSVNTTSKCPYPGCNENVEKDDPKLKWFQHILKDMFKEYTVEEEDTSPIKIHPMLMSGSLTITLLTGDSIALGYNANMTILQLKKEIEKSKGIGVFKQKLLYGDVELADYINQQESRLLDYNVKPNSTICLVILLYAIPEAFNDVVFDLYWGYPLGRVDYLDASCLMFGGTSFIDVCDYRGSKGHSKYAVTHSGDVMDNVKKIGHHTINIRIKDIPHNITHLFFTLSAWSSPDISRYPNPSLKFYEKSKPGKDLCKTTFHHARASQAVVMCSMSRNSHGRWEIFESGKLSAGNAMNYDPIQKTIVSLIKQGY